VVSNNSISPSSVNNYPVVKSQVKKEVAGKSGMHFYQLVTSSPTLMEVALAFAGHL